jgi:hypothetical protein
MTRLSTKLIVALSLLAIVFAIGAPVDILFPDNVPANQNLCIFEPSNNQNLLNSGVGGNACPRPYKDGRFWDQGEGNFCYLVSILNSNIYSGVNDSDNQFYKSFMECLENYGVNICQIGREGVEPGSFEDEIIKGCKMLEMNEIGEPVGLDEYKLRKPWWDWQTETHSIVDLCAKIKEAIQNGGGAWTSVGSLPGAGTHTVSILGASLSPDGKYCILTTMDPNNTSVDNVLTVEKRNRVVRSSLDATGTQIGKGTTLDDLTIETKLK